MSNKRQHSELTKSVTSQVIAAQKKTFYVTLEDQLLSAGEGAVVLAVPCMNSDTVQGLKRQIQVRANRHKKMEGFHVEVTNLMLKNPRASLDDDDILSDVINDSPELIAVINKLPDNSTDTTMQITVDEQIDSQQETAAAADTVTLRYVTCVDYTSKELRIARNSTLAELKNRILEKERVGNQNILGGQATKNLAVDLAISSHAIYTSDDPSVTVDFITGLLQAQSPASNLLFVTFRRVDTNNATTSASNRFAACQSWQPAQHTQSKEGMSCLLSCLYVISEHLHGSPEQQEKFFEFFSTHAPFPPALLAMYYLTQKNTIRDNDRAVLSSTLYKLFRELVPTCVCTDDKVFEQARACFGVMFSQGKGNKIAVKDIFRSVSLVCPLSFRRLQDPVSISGRYQIYERGSVMKAIEDKLPSFEGVLPESVAAHTYTKFLLDCHPNMTQVFVCEEKKAQLESGECTEDFDNNTLSLKEKHDAIMITLLNTLRCTSWSAVEKNTHQIRCLRVVPPLSIGHNCAMRLICLSDGEDTKSQSQPHQVVSFLQSNNIILDSVLIGEGVDNTTLIGMSKATGGYAFAPTNLSDALRLNELETFLYISERPDIVKNAMVYTDRDMRRYKYQRVDECSENKVPERRQPHMLSEPVQSLESTLQRENQEAVSDNNEVAVSNTVNNSQANVNKKRRILQELKLLLDQPHPSIEVFPCQQNLYFWRILLQGPESSPYQGGTWLLYANFPEEYPMKPPEIRFVTPIRHCNINHYGKVCHSIFTRNWTSDTTMKTVLDCIYGLLLFPETDDPLDSTLALQFFNNRDDYDRNIRDSVTKYATTKNRDQWRAELLDGK